MRVDIEKTAMIWTSLAEAMDEDHSGLPMGEVIPRRSRASYRRRRHRSIAVVSPGAGAGEHHQGGRDTGGVAYQGLLAGGREPHHRQLPSHQPRADAGDWPRPSAIAILFRASGRPRNSSGSIVEPGGDRIPKRFGLNPIRELEVLCPMNRGGVGARSLNIELRAALTLPASKK
jgi:hypothetical protein